MAPLYISPLSPSEALTHSVSAAVGPRDMTTCPTSQRHEEIESIPVELCDVEVEFEALPFGFDITDAEFGERFLPWVRLACDWLQVDCMRAQELARDLLRQGGEGRLDEVDGAWTTCAEAFSAISELVEAAKVRLAIARARIKAEEAKCPADAHSCARAE